MGSKEQAEALFLEEQRNCINDLECWQEACCYFVGLANGVELTRCHHHDSDFLCEVGGGWEHLLRKGENTEDSEAEPVLVEFGWMG